MKPIANLSDAGDVRARLRQNLVLRHLLDAEWKELEPLLAVEEYASPRQRSGNSRTARPSVAMS